MDYDVTDLGAIVDWAALHAPELITVDLEALATRLMLDDEDLGGVIDMQTGLRVPGVRVKREEENHD